MGTKVKARHAAMAGALTMAIGIPAVALGAGTSQAQGATVIKISHTHVGYGDRVTVTGTTSTGAAGQRLDLEFAQNGRSWRRVASTTAGSSGSYRLRAKLYRSGFLRVTGPVTATAASALTPSAGGVQPSTSQRVIVRGSLRVPSTARNVLGSRPVAVDGRLLPHIPGRKVVLEASSGRGWHTVAHAQTRSGGRFALRFVPGGLGSERLRVRFGGDAASSGTAARAGVLTVYQQTVASWYNDGGGTACGFHAGMGVANKTLPCGTKVTFMYGGRRVTATVDDRGPFVAGRTWDLNQNTAAALGMGGVATVWSSK